MSGKLNETSRRLFVGAALGTAASYSRIKGANDRIRLGAIGTGGRCQYLLSLLQNLPGNQLIAICDIYETRRTQARLKFASYANEYGDYRKLLDDKEIDAVVIGTPDHWHTPIAIDALAANKDIYVEKPVTHKLEEGEQLGRAVAASKQVVQVGMQQRSWPHIAEAKALFLDTGALGQITFIETHWYQNYFKRHGHYPDLDASKINWKAFLGSAPDQPINPARYFDWRSYWDFGGGSRTDLFTQWIDVVHWFMESTLPISAFTMGAHYLFPDRDCPDTMNATFLYPGNFQVIFHTSLVSILEGGGITLRGTEGMLRVERNGYAFYAEPEGYGETLELPLPTRQVRIARNDGTKDHLQNFLDCVRSRKVPNAPAAVGINAARPGQMGNLSFRENRLVLSSSLNLRNDAERGVCA